MAKKRVSNCVILSCLNKPGVIWRFFRRYYFNRLNRQIERLPRVARKFGQSYADSPRSFFVL